MYEDIVSSIYFYTIPSPLSGREDGEGHGFNKVGFFTVNTVKH